MDGILHMLNGWRESDSYSLWLPYLQGGALFLMGFATGALLAIAVQVDDVLAAVRQSLRDIGITDKSAAGLLGVNRGNLCDKLRGERALTLEALAKFPIEFFQAFPVRLAMRYGSPAHVVVGARLAREARRQARMSLQDNQHQHSKAGVA